MATLAYRDILQTQNAKCKPVLTVGSATVSHRVLIIFAKMAHMHIMTIFLKETSGFNPRGVSVQVFIFHALSCLGFSKVDLLSCHTHPNY